LKWVGAALGEVRDLDVYLLNLDVEAREVSAPVRPALEIYRRELRRRREKARKVMLRALDSRRYAAFIARFGGFLAGGPARGPLANKPAVVVAERLIRARLKDVLRRGDALTPKAPDEKLHALRIRGKRLRYTCEFFTDLYGKPAVTFARRVTDIQDILGGHQDAVVAQEVVSRFAAKISRRRNPALQAALGELMVWHARRAKQTRKAFFVAWRRFRGRKVCRRLERRLAKLPPAPQA